jgi:hypothetical protein
VEGWNPAQPSISGLNRLLGKEPHVPEKTEILANAQPLIKTDELRQRLDRATYTGHPEVVHDAHAMLRDGKSEAEVTAWVAEQQGDKPSKPKSDSASK